MTAEVTRERKAQKRILTGSTLRCQPRYPRGVLAEEEVEKGKLCVRNASQCLRQSIMTENWDRTSFHRAIIYSSRNCLLVIWPSFCNPIQSISPSVSLVISQSFEPSIKCKQRKAGWDGERGRT
ncbi:unnamed protein product [Brugia pahangi]|uniref:Uncharacterized protein n=1 Tax=Brugia pahangi TaxID=6280 RepID=A0A0N4T1Y6_BRUPA|nr:unnamed protein product [Brugia pahangi]